MTQRWMTAGLLLCLPVWEGCGLLIGADADQEVYRLIEKRQRQALGTSVDVNIDGPAARGFRPPSDQDLDPYAFVPHRVDNDIPESFTRTSAATRPADVPPEPATAPATTMTAEEADRKVEAMESPETVLPEQPPAAPENAELLTLEKALAYAFRHSREFQTAKEQLYLAALDLTLERYLWTPRFFGEVSSLYSIQQSPTADSRGNVSLEPDNAMQAVAQAGARQRLPYGGEIVARVINSLVRDVTNHVTNGETGQTVLEANIPLLRGAGPAAFESRYRAERGLIYAIRTFEGFRRELVVDLAADFFALQRQRQEILNTEQSIKSFAAEAEKARALKETDRRTILDVQRAEQDRLVAANNRLDTVTNYRTSLDLFKLRIGMPIETAVDVPLPSEPEGDLSESGFGARDSLQAALRMPEVSEEEAIEVALKYRLDLLNDLDRVGDAQRGVVVAENNLLPDLRATSSVRFNTRTEQRGVGHYDDEYNAYDVGLTLEMPLDRKAERNALRASTIAKNQALRDYDQSRQTVMLQVRLAIRRVIQQQTALRIQVENRNLALKRKEAAEVLLAAGKIPNRDLVEAENALLAARNRLAAVQAQLSNAILQFRRDTGTLRVDDQGRWIQPER
ncbi:MAG: TolC family protein [Phycisphaerae bacterium]